MDAVSARTGVFADLNYRPSAIAPGAIIETLTHLSDYVAQHELPVYRRDNATDHTRYSRTNDTNSIGLNLRTMEKKNRETQPDKRITELHKQALVIDSHNDAIVAHIRRGNVSLADENVQNPMDPIGTIAYLRGRVPPEEEAIGIQLNIPKMREGGIDAAFFAVDVTRAWKNHLAYALDAFGWFNEEVTANADDICIARKASDIREAKAAGKLAAVLVIENSEAVERSLNILRSLYLLGVRSIGLTHNLNTWASTGNDEEDMGGGLTRFGIALVKEMNRLGMLVDVSHISERGFWDVLEISDHPVIASLIAIARPCAVIHGT